MLNLCIWFARAVNPGIYVEYNDVKCLRGFGFSRRAYRERFNPAPYSHCRRCTLIRCAGTLDTCMHWYMARIIVMKIQILTCLHDLE